MKVVRHLPRLSTRLDRVVLTLGNFDGLHRGHQAIVERVRAAAAARGGQVVALTFHPHPLAVLAPERASPMIQSLHDRLAGLRNLGVDVVVAQRFTRAFASHTPEEFVERFLLRSLGLLHVVVGYNVTFGQGRSGTAETLASLGARHGFEVETVGPVTVDGVAVSSSAIRKALAAGEVERTAALLGRIHRLRGRVVAGERRGRTLGFPTANLHVAPRVLVPAHGVYAVRVHMAGVSAQPGVLNIGVRPTFGEMRRTIETHLLDWDGDCYGRWMELELVARLRAERRFDGPEALRAAIAADVANARRVLATTPGT
jgi:riboflavin kinase/FMN adenylyltransferase